MTKILHLPTVVGGNALGLVDGENALGFDSKLLTLNNTKHQYPVSMHKNIGGNTKVQKFFLRLKTFYQIRNNFDVYHFNFGSSLLHAPQYGINLWDLPWYSSAAKKIMTFQGCDARQKYPTMDRLRATGCDFAACFESDCYRGVCNSGKRDKQRKKTIEKAANYVDHFYALNPDLLHFLPKQNSSFLPYTVANFDGIQPKTDRFFKNDVMTIIHAPTQRVTKGTAYIVQAVEKLQQDFPGKINFKLIENTSWEAALSLYQQADLFIDQVLLGWYGAVAVEVMKMGIPVACYINEDDLHYVPEKMKQELPLININKYNCYSVLKGIINQRELLPDLGEQSRSFVELWHDPKRVASIVSKTYL